MSTDNTFAPGQRVYHCQRKEYGTYVEPAEIGDQSYVEFDGGDYCRVLTARLMAADEGEENTR